MNHRHRRKAQSAVETQVWASHTRVSEYLQAWCSRTHTQERTGIQGKPVLQMLRKAPQRLGGGEGHFNKHTYPGLLMKDAQQQKKK